MSSDESDDSDGWAGAVITQPSDVIRAPGRRPSAAPAPAATPSGAAARAPSPRAAPSPARADDDDDDEDDDDEDDDDDDDREWYEGWDADNARHFYFHAPTGQSSWTPPDAPYVPHLSLIHI